MNQVQENVPEQIILPLPSEVEVITDEIIKKFNQRYREGYDLDETPYEKWLEANHLQSINSDSILEQLMFLV